MVQRGDTAVGQFQYNLVYARVGTTVIAGPEVAFGLVLDRAAYLSNLREPPERFPLMLAQLDAPRHSERTATTGVPIGSDLRVRDPPGEWGYRLPVVRREGVQRGGSRDLVWAGRKELANHG